MRVFAILNLSVMKAYFPKFVTMIKNTPFPPNFARFLHLNDVRAYIAWSWKTTLITWYYVRVVWHTGKVVVCGAVGPRFKPRGFGRAFSVLYQDGTSTPVARRVGLELVHFPFTNAASQWLYVNLVCRFHTYLGRLSPGTLVSSYT